MKNAQIMKKLYEGIKEIDNPLKNGKKKKKKFKVFLKRVYPNCQ